MKKSVRTFIGLAATLVSLVSVAPSATSQTTSTVPVTAPPSTFPATYPFVALSPAYVYNEYVKRWVPRLTVSPELEAAALRGATIAKSTIAEGSKTCPDTLRVPTAAELGVPAGWQYDVSTVCTDPRGGVVELEGNWLSKVNFGYANTHYGIGFYLNGSVLVGTAVFARAAVPVTTAPVTPPQTQATLPAAAFTTTTPPTTAQVVTTAASTTVAATTAVVVTAPVTVVAAPAPTVTPTTVGVPATTVPSRVALTAPTTTKKVAKKAPKKPVTKKVTKKPVVKITVS
jgi:hypothetical protein